MTLPNSHCATVARQKIVDYLLNANHVRGKSKAAFFGTFGFSVASWTVLQQALIAQGCSNPVVESTQTEFGPRYTVKCNCRSHLGIINAANLKRAHKLLEGGHTLGKIVLEGF